METSEIIKEIKKDFFCFRNGAIAESLKSLYKPSKLIFGLNAPQLMELAKKYPKDIKLGMSLWEDKNCRESRLLALYIIPPPELKKETAIEMIKDIESREEADFLAFRLIRHLSEAEEIFITLLKDNVQTEFKSYFMKMLRKNLDQI